MPVPRDVRLGARRLTVLDAGPPGARDVLVWLHAYPLSAAMWGPQLQAPPAGWRVLAPDLAGLGGTDDYPPGERATVDQFAEDVVGLLDAEEVERAVIGGLSMGGYAAFAVQRRAPGRVRGLILADTRAGADDEKAREGRARALALLEREGVAGIAEDMVPKLLGASTRAARPEVAATVEALIRGNAPAGIARAIERLRDRPDSTSLLPSIRVPTLVLVGDEDGVTPPADAEAIRAAVPGASLALIPGAGHLSNLEAPAAFNAAVHTFLAAL